MLRLALAFVPLLAACHPCFDCLDPLFGRSHGDQARVTHEVGGSKTTGVFELDDGRRITSYRQTRANGTVSVSLARTYDEAGRLIHQVAEIENLGAGHREAWWEYDDVGRIRRVTADFDGEVRITTYEYRADGRVARRTTGDDIDTYRYDDGEPAIVDQVFGGTTWRYVFTQGRWLSRWEDLDADGTVRRWHAYTYADVETGKVARRDSDGDGDGVIDDVTVLTWDGDELTRAVYDWEADGALDQIDDFEYDDGRLVRRLWRSPTQGFTWVVDVEWSGDAIERIERRDVETGELLEGWTLDGVFEDGRAVTIPLAPLSSWERELEASPFIVDRRLFWDGSHEVL